MHKATILIVEDEAIVAADLANKLSQLGYGISATTASGEEAVALARELRPHLVLMDIRLAGAMDGVEAAEHIRKECDLPIIYLTANSDRPTLERATRSEPFGYILKPFEKLELVTHIEMALYKHQAERTLRESEKRYRLLFDKNPDAVFALNSEGRFQIVNPACVTISGYPSEELLAMTFKGLCAPDQLTQTTEFFQRGLKGLPYLQFETAIIRKDGQRAEVWVAAEPIVSADQECILHCTAKDITERIRWEEALRRSEAALQQANDQLRLSNETLEVRVSERTADLKQRSAQLRALAAQLTLAEENERRRIALMLHDHLQQVLVGARLHLEYLRSKTRETPHLLPMLQKVENLIVESLTATRLLTSELSPTVLYQFGVGAALSWLGRWCQEKYGLQVEVVTATETETETEEMRIALYQSVRELLFNVVKHAKVNKARVAFDRSAEGTIRIEVSDQGAGFDPNEVRSREGTRGGFGLFSLRERLDLLGAKLEIESAPGHGSRFRILVPPLPATPQETALPTVPPADPSSLPSPVSGERRVRIVLADDHAEVLDGLLRAFNDQADFEVVGQAMDGHQAVELTRRLQPDLILMDVSMPAMDGIEATRRVTAEFPGVKVIGLSMHDDMSHGEAMRRAGAVDFLDKNGPFAEVVTTARMHAGLSRP